MGERLAFTFALTGRREWGYGTPGVALGSGLIGLSARAGSQTGLAPQEYLRYEPLTGTRFINRPQEVGASPYPKYEPPSGALAPLYQPWSFCILNTLLYIGQFLCSPSPLSPPSLKSSFLTPHSHESRHPHFGLLAKCSVFHKALCRALRGDGAQRPLREADLSQPLHH